ncbi:hypothetical protein OBBRIDRAFT_276172 [Obba rivulosa]|uniref:Uncharacterized protein n=1 Tax=Obba rivulosa TaxID=1052685 RepID=A0A8E2J5B2_9APHY|nr:hypothetical protein OBBRIDRAFT_276172 [Obba rivulosa]
MLVNPHSAGPASCQILQTRVTRGRIFVQAKHYQISYEASVTDDRRSISMCVVLWGASRRIYIHRSFRMSQADPGPVLTMDAPAGSTAWTRKTRRIHSDKLLASVSCWNTGAYDARRASARSFFTYSCIVAIHSLGHRFSPGSSSSGIFNIQHPGHIAMEVSSASPVIMHMLR